MSFALGTATGRIILDYDGSGVANAEKDIGGLQKDSQSTGRALSKVGRVAAIAGVAIAGGLAVAVNSAADFEQRISAVAAVSGATGKELDDLRNKALQLGKDTAFSAGESASAIEELVKAGISVGDVLNGAADATVALAAAGGVDMPTAAGIAAAAMNTFGIAGKNVSKVADLIAGAANASATDVVGVGEAFKYVAPLASATGISIEDTTTAIAALAQAGIEGSMAGTTLRGMLQALNPVSAEAAKKMKELGIITKEQGNRFYDAQGDTKSLADISQILRESLAGLSDEQKSQALTTMFGARAMTGAIALAKQGEKGFKKLGKAVGEVSAADVAKKRMDNLRGGLEQLKGSLETVGIAIGTILIPFLSSLANHITSALNWFLTLNKGTQKAVVIFASAAAAILLTAAAIIKITTFIKELRIALLIIKGAMAETWIAALGPIALIIAAIAIVIAIFVLLYKKNEAFRKIVDAVWGAVKTAILAVVDWFKGVPGYFQTALDAITGAFSAAIDWIKSHWRLIISILLGPLGIVIALVSRFWPQIQGVFQAGINFILAIWSAFWGVFGGTITAAWGLIVAIIKLGWVIIKGLFLLVLQQIIGIVTSAFNAIKVVFTGAWNVIKAIVRAGINFVKAIITTYLNIIKAIFSTVWGAILAVLRAIWSRIGGTVTAGANHVKGVLTAVWNAIKGVTSTVWNAIVDVIRNVVNKIGTIAGSIKTKVLDALSGAATWLFTKGAEIIQGLIDGIESKIKDITGAIGKVTDKIGKFLPGSPVAEGPLKVLNQGYAGRQIVQMIVDGMNAQTPHLAGATEAVVATIPTGIAPVNGSGGRITKDKRGAGGGRTMTIKGDLDITKNGKAVLTGVAVGIANDDDDYDDTLGRMG